MFVYFSDIKLLSEKKENEIKKEEFDRVENDVVGSRDFCRYFTDGIAADKESLIGDSPSDLVARVKARKHTRHVIFLVNQRTSQSW